MKEATVDELDIDPSVQDALLRLLRDLDPLFDAPMVKAIVYPDPDLSAEGPASVDLFLLTEDPPGDTRVRIADLMHRIHEETGVHIAVHHLRPRYLDEIHRENTTFYQDLHQNGRLLTVTRTQDP